MSNKKQNEQPSGFDVSDIYFVLFRQKKLILAFAAAGILAAGALVIVRPAQYESAAELYIQYITDSKPVTKSDSDVYVRAPEPGGNSIIINETKFLTSLDLAQEVVGRIGAAKILAKAGGGNDSNSAAGQILKRLTPEYIENSSIIRITLQHPDADMARIILSELLDAYVTKSADMHKPVGISMEYLEKETKRLREQLETTEGELRQTKKEVGVVASLDDKKKEMDKEVDRIRQELNKSEVELATHNAALIEMQRFARSANLPTNAEAAGEIPMDIRKEYRIVYKNLEDAWAEYEKARGDMPKDSPLLAPMQKKIAENEKTKEQLEKLYPGLPLLVTVEMKPSGQSTTGMVNLRFESNEVIRLVTTTNTLHAQLSKLLAEEARLVDQEQHIRELERRIELQTAGLKRFLETRVMEQIAGSTRQSEGIKVNESPTPAVKMRSKKFKKFVAMLLGGGIGGGVALAFLIEMVLDRSVRRPSEIEAKLRLPLLISIPDLNGNGHRRLSAGLLPGKSRLLLKASNSEALVPVGHQQNGGGPGAEEAAPWDSNHVLNRYYGGLRDRVIVDFEVRNLDHNPKLVGVTSCSRGAGVSSTSAGLAASLSETGDGNVLLVNMNGEQGAARQFHKGHPNCGLDDALADDTRVNAFVQSKLYVVSENGDSESSSRTVHKRFESLIPKLKTSDYDYIIFDLPPVSQTSMTARLAGLMDMVLLVIESEKTSKDSVQRATKLLTDSKARVSTVLNKVHSYVPSQLHREFLD